MYILLLRLLTATQCWYYVVFGQYIFTCIGSDGTEYCKASLCMYSTTGIYIYSRTDIYIYSTKGIYIYSTKDIYIYSTKDIHIYSTKVPVWQELDYRIDICRVTKGGHIEHL